MCVFVVLVQAASTALEDALRRDFTINALFYNIHTHQVEAYVNVHTNNSHNTSPHSPLPTLLASAANPSVSHTACVACACVCATRVWLICSTVFCVLLVPL